MAGSTFGTLFRVSTFGESHGAGLGAIVDGCPAGLELGEGDIMRYLSRRKPGGSKYATQRREDDAAEILSGTFEGRTTGTPIAILIRNKDQRSGDYSAIASCYRPGHADYCYDAKYGFRDYRGGGRSSGRETAGRVAAGAVAAKFLGELGITFTTYAKSIGPVDASPDRFDEGEIAKNPLAMPDAVAAREAEKYLDALLSEGNSSGGIVECVIRGVPAGVGDPVFGKLDALLASAVMSIGAVKGVEIGDGFAAARATGRENNDAFRADGGRVTKETNHAGGILGGISDGGDILLRAAIKPTPSISSPQRTVSSDVKETVIEIKGRHDPVIVPRAVVVVESMAALVLADAMLMGMGARMDRVKKFYLGDAPTGDA